MKKLFPILLAAVLFFVAYAVLLPEPSKQAVVATRDLKAGHVIAEGDIEVRAVPAETMPLDAVPDPNLVLGQALRIDRGQGDVIRASQLGTLLDLAPNERGVSVYINDASGVAGVLSPGQRVGIVASIPQENSDFTGTFSKATIENLRVLYIDPRFSATTDANVVPSAATPQSNDNLLAGVNTDERAKEGSVVLAVDVNLQTIFYDFTSSGAVSESKTVNALELLAALGNMPGAQVTLYLMPGEGGMPFTSPGLWLPDLIKTPQPTATPSPTSMIGPNGEIIVTATPQR
jgi:pilus assembly protein CpaB